MTHIPPSPPDESFTDAAGEMTGFMATIPSLVILKAKNRQRREPEKALLDHIDDVLDENSFPVFCSLIVKYLLDLEQAETKRQTAKDVAAHYIAGSLGSLRASLAHLVKNGAARVLLNVTDYLPAAGQFQERVYINVAERRAAYILGRYAPQKIMRVLAETYEPDETTPVLLAEAQKRKLPALTTLIGLFIRSADYQPRRDEESLSPVIRPDDKKP